MLLFRAPVLAITLAVVLAATQLKPLNVRLYALNGSHEHGTATIVQRGSNVIVTIAVTGAANGAEPQFAHLHRGTCEHIASPTIYELEPVRNGHSTTRISDVTLATFTRSTYSILIHKSSSHSGPHVACGMISGA